MAILSNHVNVCSPEYQPEVFEAALEMLTLYADEGTTAVMQDEIACHLIHLCGVSVQWLVEDGFASSEDGSEVTKTLSEAIVLRDNLLDVLGNVTSSQSLPFPARAQAMVEMCDVMQVPCACTQNRKSSRPKAEPNTCVCSDPLLPIPNPQSYSLILFYFLFRVKLIL